MSTTLAAVLLAFGGVLAVLAVAYAFYRVGRAEDRDRAAAEAARGQPPGAEPRPSEHDPRPSEHDPHPHPRSPGVARDRSRPRPPRRPQ